MQIYIIIHSHTFYSFFHYRSFRIFRHEYGPGCRHGVKPPTLTHSFRIYIHVLLVGLNRETPEHPLVTIFLAALLYFFALVIFDLEANGYESH